MDYLLFSMPMSYSSGLTMFADGKEQSGNFVTPSDIEFRNPIYDEVVYTILGPVAIDANGEEMQCEYVIDFEGDDDQALLGLRCSLDWLDIAEYPVRIDPIVLKNDLYTFNDRDDGERLGFSVAVGDFDDDGIEDDIISGAPWWGNSSTGTDRWGAAYIFYGPLSADDNTPDAIINLTDEAIRGNSDYLGRSVRAADFDNDGVHDDAVVVSARDAYVVYGEGGISGVVTDADVSITPPSASGFGYGVTVGNFDGAAGDDLAFGAYSNNPNRVYIYFFDSVDWSDGVVDDGPDVTLSGGLIGFGRSLAAGNLKDNGATDYDDLVVGAYTYNVGGPGTQDGAALVFFGDGTYGDGSGVYNEDVIIKSGANVPTDIDEAERFGYSVDIGDFNSDITTDDFEDLLIGAYQYNGIDGRAYIYLTQDDSDGGFGSATAEDDDLILEETGADYFGFSVATGDFFGDGIKDALVGAYRTASYDGAAYAYDFGSGLDATSDWSLAGASGSGEYLGYSVAAGDVNGSGYDNFIVGCRNWEDTSDSPSNEDAGRVLVDHYIPEFSDFMIPMVFMITFTLIFYKRRKNKTKR
jgi:hypothetical protein